MYWFVRTEKPSGYIPNPPSDALSLRLGLPMLSLCILLLAPCGLLRLVLCRFLLLLFCVLLPALY